MTQISRPFQIALAALVLLVAVWFLALRGHSGGESSSSSSPSAASSSPAGPSASQSAPGGGTPASKGGVYHGSAPGVEGLSRAIQKARGAVAQSQQSAKEQGSAQSSSGSHSPSGAQTQSAQKHSAQTQTSQSHSARQTHAHQKQSQQAQNSQPSKAASGVPAMQSVVEGELKRGKVVAVLFWNPKGAVDDAVRRELRAAGRAQHGKLAVHVARSNQVGSFGSFTHTVQVYSTPTILLINTKGSTSSLTGLTDAFSIGQAVKEVKRAKQP
jgi:hypothetical protein